MSDQTQQRFDQWREDLERQVVAPDFAALEGAARRRSRLARASVVTGVAALVVATVVGGDLLRVGQSAPQPAAPTGVHQPDAERALLRSDASARRVVHARGATLVTLAVSQTAPEVRAAVWQRCADASCSTTQRAVAWTTSGFRRTFYAGGPDVSVQRVSDGSLLLQSLSTAPHTLLVRPDGTTVAVTDAATGPVADGESTTESGDAIDTSTGVRHPVPGRAVAGVDAPRSLHGLLVALDQGRLVWSDDDGRTWQRARLNDPPPAGATVLLAGSLDPDVQVAVTTGRSGARAYVTTDGRTWHRRTLPQPDEARLGALGDLVVLPDGRLLVSTSTGVFATDRRWTRFSRLDTGLERPAPGQAVRVKTWTSEGETHIVASSGATAAETTDLRVWRAVTTR